MKLKKILLITCCLLLSACSSSLKKYSMSATDLGFDTIISFVAYTKNEDTFKKYEKIIQQEFKFYDALFDKYNTTSQNNIKTINDQAGKQPVKVKPELIELLQASKDFYEQSDHQFDITMGSVLNLWHDAREYSLANKESILPDQQKLQQAKTLRGWNQIQIDDKNNTVYITNPKISLDVGGCAKGFAVEKIAQKLEDNGVEHAIINGGGNVRLIGSKPNGDPWQVGIQIPDIKNMVTTSLFSLQFNESTSIVTSGDYQRYYMHEGKQMHHIIDPDTLYPAHYARAVTVVCKDSGLADMLSTALFTMSYEEGMQLINNLKKDSIDVNAIWIYDKDLPAPKKPSFSIHGYDVIITKDLAKNIVK